MLKGNKHDLHGMFIPEALQYVDSVIGAVRLSGKKEEVIFIVGISGRMGESIKGLLEECEVEFTIPPNNPGQINVTIE